MSPFRLRKSKKTNAEIEEDKLDDSSTDFSVKGNTNPRFVYEGGGIKSCLVGFGGISKLASSRIVRVKFSWTVLIILVTILTAIAVFFTPQLLPKWLGFKWSTTSDLCSARTVKLAELRQRMQRMSRIPEGEKFVQHLDKKMRCISRSAHRFWNGRERVSYPSECIIANAKTKTTMKTVCVGGQRIEKCGNVLLVFRKCTSATTPRKCSTITASDPDSERRISELNAARRQQQSVTAGAINETETREIAETADKAAEKVINRLIVQIDIANNCYIAYTILALIAGAPLIIFKRSHVSQLFLATLSMNKPQFVLLVVIGLTIQDTVARLTAEVNFPNLLRNFKNDPCYLDPNFSRARLDLIRYTCGNVTAHRTAINGKVANMTSILYDAQLCEVCAVDGRGPTDNPLLLRNIDVEQKLYSDGLDPGYVYPGSCNATQLDEETAAAPETGASAVQAVLGSGVLAQILLKGILTAWITHLFGMLAPMTQHQGRIELFGVPEDSDASLTAEEERYARHFARDKHVLPLIICSLLLTFEFAIIVYSIVDSKRKDSILPTSSSIGANETFISNQTFRCNFGELIPN